MRSISVILPVYNESKCISLTVDAVLEYSKNNPIYHFIFVNDGSTDETKAIIENKILESENNHISLLSYDENKGKGHAIKKGVEFSHGDYICFIDSDLAYSLTHLDFLIDKLEFFDVVIGCRNLMPTNVKRVKFIRFVAGKVFNILSRGILSLNFSDMQAGIKGFKKEIAKDLFARQRIKRFCFDVELMYLAQKQRYSIGEIPVIVSITHTEKASKVNLAVDSLRMLISLLKIRINDSLGRYEKEKVCLVKL
ncbi:MAG TPA: glycosyltransferase [Waterburya sp.]|jgi:glycosyltransferase involved in cell wall biosynthesis